MAVGIWLQSACGCSNRKCLPFLGQKGLFEDRANIWFKTMAVDQQA